MNQAMDSFIEGLIYRGDPVLAKEVSIFGTPH